MAETRWPSERYAEIGAELVAQEESLAHVRDSGCAIRYLASDAAKTANGALLFGQCEKVPAKYRWALECDFTITLFEPNIADMTDEQVRILIFHELLHVGVQKTKDGGERYYIVPHDYEEFREIAERFGVDWDSR